jgi:hypothetical protein
MNGWMGQTVKFVTENDENIATAVTTGMNARSAIELVKKPRIKRLAKKLSSDMSMLK